MTFNDVMDADDYRRAMQRKMQDIAIAAGCVPINEQLLVEGDRFKLFINGGAKNALEIMTVGKEVFVWDGCDSIGYGHSELTRRKACFTGEDVVAVIKSNVSNTKV